MYFSYTGKSLIKWSLYLILIVFCVSGCGQDEKYEDGFYKELRFEFLTAPGVLQEVRVTSIELIISSPELDEPLNFKITDINPAERSARASIRVPLVNNLTFSVKAFEEECPVLSGILENVNLSPNYSAPLTIRLNPARIIIGIQSAQDQINVGDTYNAEFYIKDAPRVFAFTCELSFDENLLEPVDISPGNFFGNDVIFLEESELPGRQTGQMALGITLKRDDTGKCGSGTLFQLTFRAASSGNARINIIQNDKLTLKTPSPEFSQIEKSRVFVEKGVSVAIK